MTHIQLTNYKLPSNQRGEGGIGGIVSMIILAVLCIKLGLAIVPAQLNDRQLDEAIAKELKKSNDNKESKARFLKGVKAQLKINGYYDLALDDMYKIEGTAGNFFVTKKYEVGSDLFPGVAIVNTFEGKILAAGKAE